MISILRKWPLNILTDEVHRRRLISGLNSQILPERMLNHIDEGLDSEKGIFIQG